MSIEELFVDSGEVDQQLLVTVLKPYLRIDPKRLIIRPEAKWKGASNRARLIAFLLARKALVAKILIAREDEAISPAEIIKGTGVPSGSVYPTLKELFEARPQVVDKEREARYLIPDWAVNTACDILQEGA